MDLSLDLEENLDYVREKTGQDRLHFIGHAHGATQLFMRMAANRPDIDAKLASIIGLGATGSMHYTENPLVEMYSRYWRSFES